MKKITLLACACALSGMSLVAQEAQEVQYVEDPSQGYLVNNFSSNWFITAQGGINAYFSHHDAVRDFQDRLAPNANIYVGKWFTPVWGARVGVEWLWLKGMTTEGSYAAIPGSHKTDGYVKERMSDIGPAFDVMANLTNLFCGYKPNRVYNFVLYGGAGGYWTMIHHIKNNGEACKGWHNGHDKVLTFRAGFINSFRIAKGLDLQLDLRASAIDGVRDGVEYNGENRTFLSAQAYLGLTYNFQPRQWHAPVVPVCPPAENCDALRARLAAADARIADLEGQLRDCLNRPVEVKEAEKAPLATIYYPINVYRLTREDNNVLEAIANVMKDNSNTKYVLTGWADNYTGTDAINKRLRQNRVNGVYNKLVKCGVPENQLTATTNNGNLCDLGEKFVALDRAVTIEEAE